MKFLFVSLVLLYSNTFHDQNKTYYNDIGGYEIAYNETWTITTDGDRTTLHAPKESKRDTQHENLGISRSSTYGLSLQEAYDQFIIEAFPTTFKDFRLIDQGDQKVNNVDSKWIKFSFYDEQVGINATNYIQLTIVKESLYILIGYASTQKFPEYEDSFKQIIQTIKFR